MMRRNEWYIVYVVYMHDGFLISRNVDVYIPVPLWSYMGPRQNPPPVGTQTPNDPNSTRSTPKAVGVLPLPNMLTPPWLWKSRRGREIVYMLWSTQISDGKKQWSSSTKRQFTWKNGFMFDCAMWTFMCWEILFYFHSSHNHGSETWKNGCISNSTYLWHFFAIYHEFMIGGERRKQKHREVHSFSKNKPLHPRRLTAGTWKWWFGVDDFPFPGVYSQVPC